MNKENIEIVLLAIKQDNILKTKYLELLITEEDRKNLKPQVIYTKIEHTLSEGLKANNINFSDVLKITALRQYLMRKRNHTATTKKVKNTQPKEPQTEQVEKVQLDDWTISDPSKPIEKKSLLI